MKNRPFYDGGSQEFSEMAPAAVPDDAVLSSKGHYYKVSDIVITPDNIDTVVFYTEPFGIPTFIYSGDKNLIASNNAATYIGKSYDAPVFVSAANAGPVNDTILDTYPEPGIYLPVDVRIGGVEGKIFLLKKLDSKFLDLSSYATKAYVDNLIGGIENGSY